SVQTAFGSPQPVDRLIQHVLDGSSRREFGDDILLFWLQREVEQERERAGDRPAPRWFSPFGEAHGTSPHTA
ncbi:MAG: hypothetical protein O3C45_11455, partial [Bacteroidetes bacterium]|nr:hypothetical protein [Bacteroidota bacterium]